MDKNNGARSWSRYTGKLGFGEWPSKDVKRAYSIWCAIGYRCGSKNSPDYNRYGNRGIKREIDSRDFIGWYVFNLNSRNWKWATVGRIDHSRGYFLENMIMQEMSDNVKERINRLGTANPSKPVWRLDNMGRPICFYPSMNAAARNLGIDVNTVILSIRRRNWHGRARYKFNLASDITFGL